MVASPEKSVDGHFTSGSDEEKFKEGVDLDFNKLDYSKALEHLKTRKMGKRKKGIVGCHDQGVFFDQDVIRSIDVSKRNNFKLSVGKLVDEVEEIIITSKNSHSTVPGVTIVEYKIPGLSNRMPPLTTGELVTPSNGGVKTLYDSKIWTDSKLEDAAKEALLDASKKVNAVIDGKFNGLTKEGYKIEGYIKNGNVDTFYFL